MRHSSCSFMFFIKERKRTLPSFWFHKSYKNDKSRTKKQCKRTQHSFYKVKKELNVLFSIYVYLYIYTYIYLYISIYLLYIHLYIFIEKKNKGWACILFKRTQRSAFFCIRMLRSLHSFTFFEKECCVLCAFLRSLQKNVGSLRSFTFFIKECGVLCILLRSI